MAMTAGSGARPNRLANNLLCQREALIRVDRRRADVAARIESYELRYGIKSHSVHMAIERGELTESQEVCR